MTALLTTLAFTLLLALVMGSQRARLHETLGRLADRTGLALQDTDQPHLDGQVDGRDVRLDKDDRSVRLSMQVRVSGSLRLRTQAGGVPLGDPAFDRCYTATGPDPIVLAALDRRARRALVSARAFDLGLEDGRLTATLHGVDEDTVVSCLTSMVGVAEAVERSARHGLVAIARHDPQPSLRARALAALSHQRPAVALEIVDELLGDPDPADLLDHLTREPDDAVAAALVLTHVGEVDAVTRLQWAAARHPALAGTFRHAAARIQKRVDPRAVGGLSLTERGTSGGLTAARSQRGAVSVPGDR